MKKFSKFLTLFKDRSGATVIEYCIIAGLISIAVVGGATTIGSNTNNSFNAVQAGFEGS